MRDPKTKKLKITEFSLLGTDMNSTFLSTQIIKVKSSLAAFTLEATIYFARAGNPSVILTTLSG